MLFWLLFVYFTMATYTLSVLAKTQKKTRPELHKEGLIPGVVYGPGMDALALYIKEKDFIRVFHAAGMSQIIVLEVEGKTNPTLVHEVQRDPLTGRVHHVDFYHVTKGHKVSALIPLEFVGVSTGVKDLGGTLVTHIRDLEVEGLPDNLPAFLSLDISSLKEFGDEIDVSDIALPEGVAALAEPSLVVVSLLAPAAKEKEEAPVVEESSEAPPPEASQAKPQ